MGSPLPAWSTVTAAVEHADRAETVLTHGAARAIVAHRALTTSALAHAPRAVIAFLLTGEVAAPADDDLFTALYSGAEYSELNNLDRFTADMLHAYFTARIDGVGTMDTRPVGGWGDNMALTR